MKYLMIYFITINIIAFAVMGIDKSKAKRSKWRIRERTLFAFALFGGSIGIYGGMQKFRHKTHHKQFVIGIPMIIILQAAIAIYLAWRLQ